MRASVDQTFAQLAFTTAFYSNEFMGRVVIQATLDEQPDAEDEMWFDQEFMEINEPNSGIIAMTAIGGFSWLRFVVRTDSGEITKVLLQR